MPCLNHPLDAHRHSCQSWSPGVPSLLQPAPTFLINPADIHITHFHLFPVRLSYAFFTEHSWHFTCLFDLLPQLWTPSFLLAPRLVLVCLALLVCLVSWLLSVYLWALHLGPTNVFFFFFSAITDWQFSPQISHGTSASHFSFVYRAILDSACSSTSYTITCPVLVRICTKSSMDGISQRK